MKKFIFTLVIMLGGTAAHAQTQVPLGPGFGAFTTGHLINAGSPNTVQDSGIGTGGISGAGLTVAPGAFVVSSNGSGYAAGDTVTLQCPGITFSTIATNYGGPSGSPILAITNTSPLGVSFIQTGYTTSAPATANCLQASTTGSGAGLLLTVAFAPIAGAISQPTLNTGTGVAYNGNYISVPTGVLSSFAGNVNLFIGYYAGANFSGTVTANLAVGDNALGVGGSAGSLTAATGSYNTGVGIGAGRNFSGAANNNSFFGSFAGGNETASGNGIISGASNTCGGSASCQSLGSTNNNTAWGAYALQGSSPGGSNAAFGEAACQNCTGGTNTAIGAGTAPSLTSGSHDLVLGQGCDVSAAAASNEVDVCAGSSSPVIRVAGGGTPSTSTATIYGSTINLPNITNASGNEILCWDSTGGPVTYESSVAGCVPSAMKLKNPMGFIDPVIALAGIISLQPAIYIYKNTAKFGADEHDGLYADQVCAIDERLCDRDKIGEVHNYDKVGMLAYLVAAIQAQQQEIEYLRYRR